MLLIFKVLLGVTVVPVSLHRYFSPFVFAAPNFPAIPAGGAVLILIIIVVVGMVHRRKKSDSAAKKSNHLELITGKNSVLFNYWLRLIFALKFNFNDHLPLVKAEKIYLFCEFSICSQRNK